MVTRAILKVVAPRGKARIKKRLKKRKTGGYYKDTLLTLQHKMEVLKSSGFSIIKGMEVET